MNFEFPHWASQGVDELALELQDNGVRYADILMLKNGWIYKVQGNLHPPGQILCEPDWGPSTRHPVRRGLAKVRDYMWPDKSPAPRVLPTAGVPLYGRAFEVVRPDEIAEIILPEAAAARALTAPRNAGERLFGDLVTELCTAARISSDAIGLNGSFGRGLSVPESDFDLDVYGVAESVSVSTAVDRLCSGDDDRWTREWPPDKSTSLYYVWQAAYPDMPPDQLWNLFVASQRDAFNFVFAGMKVSLAYHPVRRDQSAQPILCSDRRPARPQYYVAEFGHNAGLGHLEYPAFVELIDVRTAADGKPVAARLDAVSFSKAFCFCKPGDLVRFRARESYYADGDRFLCVPSYGPDWPVKILTTTTTP